jgi:hypothetical protein
MPHRVKGACRSPATRAMTFNSFDDDGRPVRYLLLRLQPVSVGIDHVWGGARHIWGSSPFVVVESTLNRRPTGRPMTPTGRVSVEAHSVIPQLLPIESEGTAQQHGDVDCRCCRRCRWIDARHGVNHRVHARWLTTRFPAGTVIVNLGGCFARLRPEFCRKRFDLASCWPVITPI